MDKYHQIHGHDVASFDLSSTHRLPTVSAAAALDDLEDEESTGYIPTGLPSLDRILANVKIEDTESPLSGGILKGQLTEVWGPPGSGKTALGIQLAVNAIEAGGHVTWVDAFHPMCQLRLNTALQFAMRFHELDDDGDNNNDSRPAASERLDHFTCPSLAHLLALLCRPTARSVAPETSLIVIDSLSALVNRTYPRAPEAKQAGRPTGNQGNASGRNKALQYMVECLQKLAATSDIAIVVLSQCATKLQFESGATLIPSLNGTAWEQGLATRIVLFKDWIWRGGSPSTVNFMGVQKLNGKPTSADNVVAFKIEPEGLSEVVYDASQPAVKVVTPKRKRKLDATAFEIPDSEDEEYGWDVENEDNAMPSTLAPQWQGSEDVLLQPSIEDDGNSLLDEANGDEGLQLAGVTTPQPEAEAAFDNAEDSPSNQA